MTFRLGVSKGQGKLRNPGCGKTGGDRRKTSQTRGCHLPSRRNRARDWRTVHASEPTPGPGDRSDKRATQTGAGKSRDMY